MKHNPGCGAQSAPYQAGGESAAVTGTQRAGTIGLRPFPHPRVRLNVTGSNCRAGYHRADRHCMSVVRVVGEASGHPVPAPCRDCRRAAARLAGSGCPVRRAPVPVHIPVRGGDSVRRRSDLEAQGDRRAGGCGPAPGHNRYRDHRVHRHSGHAHPSGILMGTGPVVRGIDRRHRADGDRSHAAHRAPDCAHRQHPAVGGNRHRSDRRPPSWP